MASQYNLQLKAILDTTQVKQELQKLRTLQQQVLGNNNQNRDNKGGSNNLGNLNSLNSTLGRLTSAITQLNTNISKLNMLNQKAVNVNRTTSPSIALSPRASTQSNSPLLASNDVISSSVKTNTDIESLKALKSYVNNSRFRGSVDVAYRNKLWDSPWNKDNKKMQLLKAQFDSKSYPEFRDNLEGSKFKKLVNQQINAQLTSLRGLPPQSQMTPDMKRMMAGMAFGQGINALLNMNQQLGIGDGELFSIGGMKVSQNNALNGFGKIASYGAMGSAAGPWGAAIGAAIGAIETFADVLVSNAKEIEEELARDNMAIERGRQVGEARRDYEYDRMMKRNLEGEDLAEVQHMKDRLERSIKENREMLDFVSENGYRASNSMTYLQGIQRDEARLDAVNQYIENFNKQKDAFAKQYGAEKLSLERYDESRYNNSLITNENTALIKERRGYYNDRAEKSRYEYETYLKNATVYAENGKFRLSREQMEKAMTSKSDWQYYMNEFNKLSQFKASNTDQLRLADDLKEVMSKLTAPSMENVNSLAGQGLMINRRDDYAREQVMEDYQREQTELQRQIKDILQQDEHGSTESIIW